MSQESAESRREFWPSHVWSGRGWRAYSVIASAKVDGHEPFACLREVLTRLRTTLARDLDTLLPWNLPPVAADWSARPSA